MVLEYSAWKHFIIYVHATVVVGQKEVHLMSREEIGEVCNGA